VVSFLFFVVLSLSLLLSFVFVMERPRSRQHHAASVADSQSHSEILQRAEGRAS
jgi:uncharacterized membrane protein YecN with MAPEG domain